MSQFDLSSYDFDLPPELIAQTPSDVRDGSRLMKLSKSTGTISHHRFRDLPEILSGMDQPPVLVANNSKVFNGRYLGHRIRIEGGKTVRGGKIEVLLLKQQDNPNSWEAIIHASAAHRRGLKFEIPCQQGDPLIGEVVRGASESGSGSVGVRFDRNPLETDAGWIPLPPYIDRNQVPRIPGAPSRSGTQDENRYQTVYAKTTGSSAAPTAGLHFTPELVQRLKDQGTSWEEITLHVGLGTFRPVKVEDVREHQMHEEEFKIHTDVSIRLNEAKSLNRKVIAVGTTSLRSIESAAGSGQVFPQTTATKAFFYPGGEQKIRFCDGLITNFHVPKSTLLMLVCAFAGTDFVRAAYEEAIRERYRFYSYGDAMLIV